METCLMHVFTEYFIGMSPTQINSQYNNMVGWSCSEKSIWKAPHCSLLMQPWIVTFLKNTQLV